MSHGFHTLYQTFYIMGHNCSCISVFCKLIVLFVSCYCYLTDSSSLTLSLGPQRWGIVAEHFNVLQLLFTTHKICFYVFLLLLPYGLCWYLLGGVFCCLSFLQEKWLRTVSVSSSLCAGRASDRLLAALSWLQQHCWDGKHSHSVMSQWALGNPETSGQSYWVGGSFDHCWQWNVPFTEK